VAARLPDPFRDLVKVKVDAIDTKAEGYMEGTNVNPLAF
jgi:hypothetical protein